MCRFVSDEDRMKAARLRAKQRFEDENLKISQAYKAKKKEEARQKAIKRAKTAKRAKQNPGGKF